MRLFSEPGGALDGPIMQVPGVFASPAASLAADPQSFLAEKEARVWFAGTAPGFVGLLQMNVLIPADAETGDAVPLRIAISGHSSPPGTTVSIK